MQGEERCSQEVYAVEALIRAQDWWGSSHCYIVPWTCDTLSAQPSLRRISLTEVSRKFEIISFSSIAVVLLSLQCPLVHFVLYSALGHVSDMFSSFAFLCLLCQLVSSNLSLNKFLMCDLDQEVLSISSTQRSTIRPYSAFSYGLTLSHEFLPAFSMNVSGTSQGSSPSDSTQSLQNCCTSFSDISNMSSHTLHWPVATHLSAP